MNEQAYTLETRITKAVRLNYLLWLPDDYRTGAAQSWPLILFLHGLGERGDDLEQVKRYGLPAALEQGFVLPAIVVVPQCPSASDWSLLDDALIALLDEVATTHAVDPCRVYLTGLSMGGRGTWHLAALHPERFAAIAPICGRRPDWLRAPEQANLLREVPTWVFHGALDPVVPREESDLMVAALRGSGATVEYTVYPELGHDSWTATYSDPRLYDWLLNQTRP